MKKSIIIVFALILSALLCGLSCAALDESVNGITFNDRGLMYALDKPLDNEPVTVEIYLRFKNATSSTDGGTFFGNFHPDELSNNMDFGIGKYGRPEIRVRDDGKVYKYVFTDVNVYTGSWVHLTLVRDVANGVAKCYVDGVLADTVAMTDEYDPLELFDYRIGANLAHINPDYFKGEIGTVAAYSDVRTDAEIASDIKNGIGKDGLLVAYSFKNASGTPLSVADLSGGGNTAYRNRMFFDGGEVSTDDYAYTFAVVGDTQNMAKTYYNNFNDIYNYIYDNIEGMNIEAVLGLGDITDTTDNFNTEKEWKVAKRGLEIIDDYVLSIPIIGNHDNFYWYNKIISQLNYGDLLARYKANEVRDGYIAKEIGGIPYLFVILRMGAPDSVLEFASKAIEQHPDHNVVVLTHGYLNHDYTTLGKNDPHVSTMTNTGDDIWDKLISKHENIVLVLSGHIGHDYVIANQRKGVNGNTVTEILLDFQSSDNASNTYGISKKGLGTVNLFHFTKDGKAVIIETVSTVLGKHFMERNQMRIELDTVTDSLYVKPQRDPLPERAPAGELELDDPNAEGEETVIYKNDFSDPSTLSDFTQYRMQWEIKNGGLYMTNTAISGAPSVNASNVYGVCLYNSKEPLDNYIVDVDFHNACTQSGVVVRSMTEFASHAQNDFAGYLAYVSNDLSQCALGSASLSGWSGLLDAGVSNENMYYGVSLHFTVTVKNDKIAVVATNLENGNVVYDTVYSIGKSGYDCVFTEGTFGLRMRAKNGSQIAYGNSYFDNLVVTTAKYARPTKFFGETDPIDLEKIIPVYENRFDSADDIADFKQFYGTWAVKNGRLYLTEGSTADLSLILYNGSDYKALKNYVIDVDMYNVQTQGGPVVRSQIDSVTGTKSGSDFYGYTLYVAYAGNKVALGYGLPSGSWGDALTSSSTICAPGADLHLQIAVKDDVITSIITNKNTGKHLWTTSYGTCLWNSGTFGFRLNNETYNSEYSNINTTSFDNLVLSLFPEDYVHDCTYGDWTVTVKPTTAKEGEKYRVCSICGDTETAVIPVLEWVVGDANGDGEINLADCLAAISHILNRTENRYADISGDGKISIIDVIRLLKKVAR